MEKPQNPGNIMGLYILDPNGQPIEEPDVLTWSRWIGSHDRHIAVDDIGDDFAVSTVFLGIDHNHTRVFGEGSPVLFESLAFGPYGSLNFDWANNRYATREEALEGHQAIKVELLLFLEGEKHDT